MGINGKNNTGPASTIEQVPREVGERLANVRLLLMDLDGVLTDGFIHLDDNGTESKSFSARDGFALIWARQYGLRTGVISGRLSLAAERRCRDLKFDEMHLGVVHKVPVFEDIMRRTMFMAPEVAYIGDDLIDLPIMSRCGISAAPNDAHPEVLRRVDIIVDRPGGAGAVRLFIDFWLKATGRWETAIEDIFHGNF